MAGGLGARPRVPTMGLTQEQAELIISFVKSLFEPLNRPGESPDTPGRFTQSQSLLLALLLALLGFLCEQEVLFREGLTRTIYL